jgi:hypothetical protein
MTFLGRPARSRAMTLPTWLQPLSGAEAMRAAAATLTAPNRPGSRA